ncbi:MAG: MaoC family dehydratase [Robiginitomaculum sp.]|nr:MaoC family dehydratase [Robiginitomaculum sp.]
MAGLYFDEFEVGHVFEHELRRTITESDNMLFSNMTLNPQPLHIDHEFAKNTEFGKPLVNSIFTLGLAIGISVADTTLGTTVGNLGMSDTQFPHPVFHGDTIHVTTEVSAKRASKSRPGQGIITFIHRAYNQDNILVVICHRAALMRGSLRPADKSE